VVGLDGHRRTAVERDAFDHIGIERALGEKLRALHFLGFGFEDVDERLADELALGLGIGDAGEAAEEGFARIHMDERDVVVAAEELHYLFGFVGAHEAGVDENARELVADGFVDKHGGDG
jgi:hypothetical protein